MFYRSLKSSSKLVNFEEAVKKGLAEDGGLFFPKKIKKLKKEFIENLEKFSNVDIAYEVIKQFIGDEINENDLKNIITNTIDFDFPLIDIEKNVKSLELFHGPTLAFKDVGARFMANCLGYFNKKSNKTNTVLVATSGDTGAAVANGFLGVKGTNVVILYPKNMVSEVQEKQLTTNKKNITAFRVDGTFDDCQQMVKKAFIDKELNNELNLTSANSINVARWLPQMFYYFFAIKQLKTNKKKIVFSVPSGNFGNICAGAIAMKLGLPIDQFVASTNSNDTIPRYLNTKNYNPKKTIPTISNAMDVSNPSNFIRIEEIFQDFNELKNCFSSYSFNDDKTLKAVKSVYKNSNYILDPHGAVGYLGLKKFFTNNSDFIGIFLETAHPIKFSNHIENELDLKLKIPQSISKIISKKKRYIDIENYSNFKRKILNMGLIK
ncbi:threonine synthase [Flavobacteriaceae bacterium]|nr:threonine synthase [Flavobacteriaceae bacterium]